MDSLEGTLDCRDRWAGIRQLRTPYKPVPYFFKGLDGKRLSRKDRAEGAAEYLAKVHWAKGEEQELSQKFIGGWIQRGFDPEQPPTL